jgi:hypothetical protein
MRLGAPGDQHRGGRAARRAPVGGHRGARHARVRDADRHACASQLRAQALHFRVCALGVCVVCAVCTRARVRSARRAAGKRGALPFTIESNRVQACWPPLRAAASGLPNAAATPCCAPHLAAQRVGQAAQRELGRAVRREARHAHEGRQRRDDHHAPAPPAHLGCAFALRMWAAHLG